MDEYKQLKESLNRAPSQRQPEQNPAPQQPQAAAIAPESHVHEARQQDTIPVQTHKEEPAAHEEERQHTESKVTWYSFGILFY